MRLDLFLWYARFAKTRPLAQAICEAGTLRLDGRRIDRAHATVRVGTVLAFPLHGRVRVVRIDALPHRRGPPAEAAALYVALDGTAGPAPKGVDAPGSAA
ncbi:RNA-binding S4 domain-containing protein [Sphingomonas baiyangensis]|uniref:RNA-binding S4 domain-containing protein n=2 Tax=Sphingomonas baiyangensis TaxID=2572576 RepID=A0A4U1L5L5_9SPHN|nr:RNA-binding S4 domain-containing protein [Sphingomonas baiyangensis]